MRLRPTMWIAACLLLLAGAWLLWRMENSRTISKIIPHQNIVTSVRSTSTAPNPLAGTTVAANVAENVTATVKTNPFAYRLSNTSKSIAQLTGDRHAILLENALIDTGSPLNLSIPSHLRANGDAGAYIVQARAPANAAFRNLLQQTGARIVSYIPNDAYLISASATIANLLRAQSPVQAVIPYEPYYKFQDSLIGLASENLPLPDGTLLKLGLFSDNTAQTTKQIEQLGGKVLGQDTSPFGPVLIVKPPQNWTALAQLPSPGIIEPYRQRIHANDLSRPAVGVAADSQTITNYMGLTGSNVMVEVNDSGIDTNHPDFLTGGAGTALRIFFNDPANGIDTDGHGTHVAGIIAGDGFESTTVTNAEGSINPGTNGQFRGMAPLAKLFSMSFNAADSNLQMTAAITNALISNNSWNYDGDSSYDLAAASYDAATRDSLPTVTGSQPVLFVFSAGNQGGGNNDGSGGFPGTILSPATAKNVITVGAVEQYRYITNVVTNAVGTATQPWKGETDSGYSPFGGTSPQVADFSSRGNVGIGFEGTAGRFKPDVVAPGTFVVSTRSSEWATNAYYNPTNNHVTSLVDLLHTNAQTDPPLQFFVYNDTVSVTITASSATNNLPIRLWEGTDPHTPPDVLATNSITINPPYNPPPLNVIWQCAVSNTTAGDLPYTLTVNVHTTNDVGNYYQVLQGMNDSLGSGRDPDFPNGFYRYETGTSMSAADVSGVLALMADYFTNICQLTPSPALLKALLINGARPAGNYNYQVKNSLNYEGWGQISLPNSIQPGLTNQFDQPCETFFQDQSPTNALATGDSHTYYVTLDTTNTDAQFLPLQITLAWTDPPGNPVAAIKLVNNLDLVVSNMDTGDTYFGNDIPAGSVYNNVWSTNDLATATNVAGISDSINNIEQVILPPLLDGHYAVTVIGKSVNVNAVYAQSNNIVQDYALVVACGEGEVTNAFTVADGGITNQPTSYQNITVVTVTNTPLFNQFVGASSPLLGTNQINLGTNLLYGTNGLITLGQTNQWHFYIITNTGAGADFTNAAFITFLPDTLALPRTGVYADTDANSTRPEADIDLYVSTNSAITNLDPAVIAGADKSLGRGGTEFVTYTNSVSTAANPNNPSVYYVGVKSEDQMASEYAFIPIFTDIPFGQSNSNGDQYINGLNVPVPIPDGSPSHPGVGYVFAIGLQQEEIKRVVVTNIIQHQNFGDLVGLLSHSDQKGGNVSVTLNSHDEPATPPPPGPYTNVYDDSGQNDIPGTRTTDGPGSLNNYVGGEALGVWILSEIDNSQTQTGTVQNLSLFVEKHQNPTKGITVTIQPNSWFYTYIDVPAGYTNLQLFGTNLVSLASPPIGMYLRYNAEPDQNNYDFETNLVNPGPTGWGAEISDGPPLAVGRYFVGLFNGSSSAQTVYLLAQLNGNLENIPYANFTTNNTALLDDAVSSSTIYVPATNLIASVNVGLVVQHPRISDLSFTLISPTGQRILLMEDRGGPTTQNAGHLNILTNYFGTTQSGTALASTNVFGPVPTQGTLIIDYNFYTVPDQMDVYYDGVDIFSTNTFNPGGPGREQPETFTIPYGPGVSTNITIVMNQGNNPNTTAWTYTPRVVFYDYNYLTFTEDTNLTQTPIKYAIPPFDLTDEGTNFTLSDFEQATNGDYFGPTNIYDPLGGWTVPTNILFSTNLFTNEVSVVTDPHDSFVGGNTNLNGTNFLALANGYIIRTNSLTLQRTYSISYLYRGPGISGWWRGEGDALDSSDPERLGQNGSLIGRFDFPAGEVGQAFEFEDAGADFGFAGTNTYVQIRQQPVYTLTVTNEAAPAVLLQSTPLDVGAGGGLTVEGWINPTNIAHQEPLVEWLARVPTNGSDTNLTIIAGPFLDRDTDHYYYMLAPTNWTTSEQWAEQLGGHLATVDTANEENWIYDNFGNYGFTNHNLWIGLTNNSALTTFGWVSGVTNVVYTNWATGQPNNSCSSSTELYTVLLGPTNVTPGLWAVADKFGNVCATISSTNIYGVVEVPDIQTNGVQLWISVTNYIGTTNDILDGVGNLYSNGCIYANLVDITDSNHIFFSQPLLIQTNVYQHVALTYDTNSGIANLFYNGTNVATTNLGVFQPKTTGDVLLGKDMSRETNNFYGGTMDEMSIYNRALSDAEILAIYNASAQTSNRNLGKFDPAYSPPDNLAEALVSLGNHTNIIFGNNYWQTGGFTFTAFTNSLVMQLLGLEPGMLLDNFTITETPIGNLYYFPEQSLDELKSTPANGTGIAGYSGPWTLEIWDNRTGAIATNSLVSWQLEFILASNPPPVVLQPEQPSSITVPPNSFVYLTIAVPDWASFATNILVSASAPVNVWFNPTNPPTGNNPGDFEITNNSTGGICSPDPMSATSTPPLPTNSYYLGVYNPNPHAVSATVEVDFDITGLSNGVPLPQSLNTNQSGRYFSFDVDTNAYEATFQLLQVSNNVDLVVRKGFPLPTLDSADYGSFNVSNADENIFVLTNSSPVPLSEGRWYLGAFKRIANAPANFTVLAKELTNSLSTAVSIITLTNGVPFNFTAGPGAALTNFFLFAPTNEIVATTNGLATNFVQAIRFELYHLSGNGDLTVQTDAPPFAPPFFESSQNPGTIPELIMIRTNNALTNLVTDWYLGVPNRETKEISYTIIAVTETNPVFAAFPGAEGAGAAAIGGRYGDVYHVTSLDDSGPSTLRDAVTASNRTVVFDVSGPIFLKSPLVITNSFLTIAGQTAPGGGISVEGAMTTIKSAHDVVIRDIRFRPGIGLTNPVTVWFNGFEGGGVTNYSASAGTYFAGGWYVVSDYVDVLGNGTFSPTESAYQGHYCIDLNGSNPSGISTNIATVAGTTYALNFAYVNNPGTSSAQMGVVVNGNTLAIMTANQANSWANLPWQTTSYVFTATSPSTALAFISTNTPGPSGVLLDAVSLSTNVNVNLDSTRALQFTNAFNIVADHVSASWGTNDDLSVFNSTNVTVQWSIIADSLYNTNGPVNFGSRLRYGNGSLTFHHNLYAENYEGNPRLGDNLTLDFVNNVIYNWGKYPGFTTNELAADDPLGFTNRLNYIANYSITGLSFAGTNDVRTNIAFWSNTTNTWIFQTNNFIDSNTNGILDGDDIGWGMFTNKYTKFDRPFSTVLPAIDEAFLGYEKVLDFAGVNMSTHDYTDTNIVGRTRSQTGAFVSMPFLSGIVDWWKAENNALDSIGINNGTLGSATVFTNGEVGQAFFFDGSSSSYVSIPDSPSLDSFSNSITIELWFKSNQTNANAAWQSLVSKGNAAWEIQATQGAKTLSFFMTGPNPTFVNGNRNVNDRQWHHVAATYDGANICLYVDGTLDASTPSTGLISPNSFPMGIGYNAAGPGNTGPNYFYNGCIDEVSLYHRALAANEIAAIYSIGKSGKFSSFNNFPYLDTDQDGIPDFWEITFGEARFTPSVTQDRDGDGYTDLEEYNNWLAGPHALTITNTSVGVDLQQLFGNTGNLSFSVTNAVQGFVYLTNVLNYTNVAGTVFAETNTGTFSNSFAIFTPTNNYFGYASFDVFVTNNNTIAHFGPETVSVVVSERPVQINSNMPPVITTLTSGVLDPTNYSGSDYYKFTVTNNPVGVLFQLTNIVGGPVDLLAKYGLPLPSLSDYDYISSNIVNGSESIFITQNSMPRPLTNGDWYLAVVNVSDGAVIYDIRATALGIVYPPMFSYPTNNMFTNIETTPFSITCRATDTNSPPLPLTYAIVTNVPGMNLLNVPDTNIMTIDPNTGVINWTPDEAQGPSTNFIAVSVSNGSYTITNDFTVIVEESNLPPFWPTNTPSQTNYFIHEQSTLVVVDTATDTDIPVNPLTYTALNYPAGASIDTNGIVTWTPTLAQIGNYNFTNIVTDTNPWAVNTQLFSATNYFTVTVLPQLIFTNGLPQTNTVGAGGIDWFTVNVPTNADWATNTLFFATNLPVNILFTTNSPPMTNGAATLMAEVTNGISILGTNTAPTNIVMGGTYYLGVQNTNNVAVNYALEVDFHLISSVVPTNVIVISSITHTNIGGTNGFLLIWFAATNDLFQVQETGYLTPPIAWNTFSNVISYTSPTPTNGIGLFEFFDDGSQFPFGPTRFYRLLVLVATNTLTLPNQTNYVASVSQPLAVTNSATDSNSGAMLTYQLMNFPTPSVAPIITSNGIILWVPGTNDASAAFKFITMVTDNGLPPVTATNAFTIFVLPPPTFSSVISTGTNVTLQWTAPTNDLFEIEWATNLSSPINWTLFSNTVSPEVITSLNGLFDFMDTNTPAATKFYRLIWLPLP